MVHGKGLELRKIRGESLRLPRPTLGTLPLSLRKSWGSLMEDSTEGFKIKRGGRGARRRKENEFPYSTINRVHHTMGWGGKSTYRCSGSLAWVAKGDVGDAGPNRPQLLSER